MDLSQTEWIPKTVFDYLIWQYDNRYVFVKSENDNKIVNERKLVYIKKQWYLSFAFPSCCKITFKVINIYIFSFLYSSMRLRWKAL